MSLSKAERLNQLKSLLADKAPAQQGNREGFVNNYYPFWDMKPGQRAVVRFLPDRDTKNPRGFLVEKVNHQLTVNGQKRTVACLSMYGEDCPVCKVSQQYYKADDKINGKKYWRKKSYIAQVLVIEDPLPADGDTGETHQGKVRYVSLGYQIYNIIKEAFASEDDPLEGLPYDFEDGYDFIIKKTEQGDYSTYTMGTKFHSKQRSLSENELTVAEDGMVELTSILPKNPGLEKVQALLNADLTGEEYSEGNRSSGNDDDTESRPVVKPSRAAAPASSDEDPPFEPTPKPAAKPAAKAEESGANDVDDMLAAIRARRNASK